MLIINTLAIYLPENKNLNIFQLNDDIQALKQQQQGLNNNTNAIGQYQKSYDKISDVTKRAASVQQQQQQQQQTDDGLNAETTNIRKKRGLSEWLIAPNTRWCGRGNTANGTYNVIGGASLADKCCRRHDHCPTYISAMSNRYELFNYRPYTLSSCMCDRRFRTCLKMANDEDANTIGQLFFNFVQTQCFVLKTETICRKRGADGSCEKEEVKRKAYLRNNKRF
ncbi:acidic phospholipase A2 PA4-like [Teleopsis dalmanni]|uniref:acidic phospholipase A2 PA4-like n=1 Tax=Teleopsis dalmanni TaxID=139649 RepID=UPI0018CF998E|nr:acidic phospholipase A2 PA4-like [Teleopsis dalmanni]